MPKLNISFNGGVQEPAKMGSVILKPTRNKLAYAQNIQTGSLEYGEGLITPGAAVVALTNNDEITGMPIAYAKSRTGDAILFIEGDDGAKNLARSVGSVTDGSTPEVETGISETVAHSGHASVVLRDLAVRDDEVYLLGEDGTDGWVQKDSFTGGAISFAAVQTLTGYANGRTKIFKGADNNMYVLHNTKVDQLDSSDTYSAAAFTLPVGYIGTEIEEWNELMVFAYHVGKNTGIANRKEKGRSGIILWNLISTNNFIRDIPCPTNYISAMARKADGNLIVFGSQRSGMTTLYLFTGFGFEELYSYIGDPPLNRHCVDFDNEGNIWWQTYGGQICKYDFRQGRFEHITSTLGGNSGLGGIFTSLLGGTGNEWLAGSSDGAAGTFQMARITDGNYIGDGDSATIDYNTPLAVSGQEFLPNNSTIESITLYANKEMVSGDKTVLKFYKNGNTTPSDYLTMDFSSDGAKSSKRTVKSITGVDNFSLGVAYKQTDNSATTLPVFTAVVEHKQTIN